MKKLWAVLEVLQKGRELSNKEAWKNVQLLTNALSIILVSSAVILGVDVSDAQINTIVAGTVTIVGLVNGYLTAATSASVGLPTRSGVEAPDTDA